MYAPQVHMTCFWYVIMVFGHGMLTDFTSKNYKFFTTADSDIIKHIGVKTVKLYGEKFKQARTL